MRMSRLSRTPCRPAFAASRRASISLGVRKSFARSCASAAVWEPLFTLRRSGTVAGGIARPWMHMGQLQQLSTKHTFCKELAQSGRFHHVEVEAGIDVQVERAVRVAILAPIGDLDCQA